MNHVRPSTMVAIAVFVVAGVSYVLVRPEDTPAPESSPIPVFVVTTTLTETPDGSVTSLPTAQTTVPLADVPTDDNEPKSEESDSDSAVTTTVNTTGTTR